MVEMFLIIELAFVQNSTMTDAFAAIWAIHEEKGVPLRTAAFILALQRVTRAHIHRGFD